MKKMEKNFTNPLNTLSQATFLMQDCIIFSTFFTNQNTKKLLIN